ncbi:amidohydrolase family protein [Sphingoaurantiacus capsulatus]|uniref:Amidohydrolase family protein n=1 Tax=Sphingoaurantiacus capsulatus TaxID=1771310 RepID=A0ABV7X7C5_9SPHN
MPAPGVIDMHTHVCPATFPDCPDATVRRWPCMVCEANGRRTLTIDGKPFRQLDDRSWSAARRLADMDRDGIAVQLLSPMPELLSYWLPADAAEAMCDHVNATLAALAAEAPTRFRGIGMVPLQDPDRAVRYLPRLGEVFGMEGVEIGSNIDGRLLGDTALDPFYAAAEQQGAAIFVHALHPLAPPTGADAALVNGAGFPLDVGLAAASLISAGVMARYPKLRLGFSHGGGALPSLLGRLDKVWALSGEGGERPSVTAERFFYDSNVYSPDLLRDLATRVAPGQVFAGSDYPYRIEQTGLAAYLDAAGLAADAREALRTGAARRFLGIDS